MIFGLCGLLIGNLTLKQLESRMGRVMREVLLLFSCEYLVLAQGSEILVRGCTGALRLSH